MSLLSFFALTPAPSDDYWYRPVAGATVAGVRVDENVALTYSACWAATMLLTTSGGMIPLKLRRKLPGGGTEDLKNDQRYAMVHDAPNDDMTSMMFRCISMGQQINMGNAFAEIGRNSLGVGLALYPIHASRIPKENVKRGRDGKLFYVVKNPDVTTTPILAKDMLHVPSPISDDGIFGKGVVENARLSIGYGIATEMQGASSVVSGNQPGIAIEGATFRDREQRADFRQQWNEVHAGPGKSGRPYLLPPGAKAQILGFNLKDSQFIESRQHNVEEVARWYGVPPHLIAHLLRSTNNNIVQQALEFVKYSLMRWLVLWEQELNRKLLTRDERRSGMFFQFIVDGLERADIVTRTAALKDQFFNGALNLNQWMAYEDRNPIGPAGDIHFVQQAMIPVELAAKGPQEQKPPAEPDESEDDNGLSAIRREFDEKLAAIPHGKNGDAQELRAQLVAAREAQKQLAAAMLRDVLSRSLSAEIHRVRHIAEKAEGFTSRLRQFYDGHAETMTRSLSQPVAAYQACGGEFADDFVERHVAESLRLLDSLLDCTADELAAKVEECVSKWHEERVSV